MNKIVSLVAACAVLASGEIAHAQSVTPAKPVVKPAAAVIKTSARPISVLSLPLAQRQAIAKAMIKADLKAEKTSGALASGIASVYAFETGSRTASGRKLALDGFTAAHRTLPFGTRVLVTNKRNGKTVTVVINDRGPFVKGRVIDVTPAAAKALGFSGLTSVSLDVVKPQAKVKEAGI